MTVGYGDQGFVPPNAVITYTIYYENQPTANAPAQKVVVTDPLDSNLDWSTVQITELGFNNATLTPASGVQNYTAQTSVSTDSNPVKVSAYLNPTTGVLTWTMQSIDSTTGDTPANPTAGFLPPDNAKRQGEGYVTFTVQPKSNLANGATIYNQASIVFDANAAISTNKVTNTIDSVYPNSLVSALPAVTDTASFVVSWSGSDPGGSGIASYDIYSSTDKGAYVVWQRATSATSATFNGALGHTYSFFSMATDNIGFRQQAPGAIQQTTTVIPTTITGLSVSPSTVKGGGAAVFTVQLSGAAPHAGLSIGLTSSNPAAAPIPSSLAIAAGATSATVSVQCGNVSASTPVTVTATLNGSQQQTQLTVLSAIVTPTVTVAPSSQGITTTQSLEAIVTVSGGAGGSMPTGSVTLTSGNYVSSAATLSNGAVTIIVPAGSLAVGSDALTASYTPDANSSANYSNASGTSLPVTVSLTTPTVSVAPSAQSITTTQSLPVTISVSGGAVSPTPTGTVTLTSGSYTSASTALSSGSATISIPAGTLVVGSDSLMANYVPDAASAAVYAPATGGAATPVVVTKAAPTATLTGAPQSAAYQSQFAVTAATNASTSATITASGSCTIAGNMVTMTSGSGTCVLTASWAEDATYMAASATQTVAATTINPTVKFTGAPASAACGANFTVAISTNSTATASITASGACSIIGNVVTITSGSGVCSMTATWPSDGNYSAATATQTTAASKAASSTSITSNTPNPSILGQTVAVGFQSTGVATPTGSVVVTASTGESCTSNLNAGAGVCSLTFTTSGARTLKASYAGDSNFSSSVSSAVTQTVIGSGGIYITGISPQSASAGSKVTVSGQFGAAQGGEVVTINGVRADTASWSPTAFVVYVPASATSGPLAVVNNNNNVSSNAVNFTLLTPTVTSVTPATAPVGGQVTINGYGFSPAQGNGSVFINSVRANVQQWSDAQIIVTIPNGATSGPVTVSHNNYVSNRDVVFTVPAPQIQSITPAFGPSRTQITITGSAFGQYQGSSVVTVNGLRADTSSWSDGKLIVFVPNNASSGTVVVTVNGVVSNGVTFTVTK